MGSAAFLFVSCHVTVRVQLGVHASLCMCARACVFACAFCAHARSACVRSCAWCWPYTHAVGVHAHLRALACLRPGVLLRARVCVCGDLQVGVRCVRARFGK